MDKYRRKSIRLPKSFRPVDVELGDYFKKHCIPLYQRCEAAIARVVAFDTERRRFDNWFELHMAGEIGADDPRYLTWGRAELNKAFGKDVGVELWKVFQNAYNESITARVGHLERGRPLGDAETFSTTILVNDEQRAFIEHHSASRIVEVIVALCFFAASNDRLPDEPISFSHGDDATITLDKLDRFAVACARKYIRDKLLGRPLFQKLNALHRFTPREVKWPGISLEGPTKKRGRKRTAA